MITDFRVFKKKAFFETTAQELSNNVDLNLAIFYQ